MHTTLALSFDGKFAVYVTRAACKTVFCAEFCGYFFALRENGREKGIWIKRGEREGDRGRNRGLDRERKIERER